MQFPTDVSAECGRYFTYLYVKPRKMRQVRTGHAGDRVNWKLAAANFGAPVFWMKP
jgi:hypothetical protein